tara:strand:- start:668 stop:811 length:144 start_codon:yes stop_codon:yes gene_type:complete
MAVIPLPFPADTIRMLDFDLVSRKSWSTSIAMLAHFEKGKLMHRNFN